MAVDLESRSDAAAERRRAVLPRLLRLWAVHARLDAHWIVRDAKNAALYYLSDLLMRIAEVMAALLLAERFHGIGAWSRPQVVFLLGYALLTTGVLDTLFNYNVSFISRRVGRGQLDHLLVQPQPLWMALLTEGFAPFSGSIALWPGGALLVWAISHLGLPLTPAWLLLATLYVVASALIILSFSYLWGSLAFWEPRAAEEISSSSMHLVDQLKAFPLDGVTTGLRSGLLSIVPIGFAAWYPSRVLVGLDRSGAGLVATPLAAVAFVIVTILVFRKGLAHYARTGSQRYLSFGHRR